MRSGLLLALVVSSAELVGCSSSTPPMGAISFNISESLLVLYPGNPTIGYAVLSSGTGNCPMLQSGVQLYPPLEAGIGEMSYLVILLGALDSAGNATLPVVAGNYTIVDPTGSTSSSFTPPGLASNLFVLQTDSSCSSQLDYATSGTAALLSLNAVDGGISPFSYTAVVNGTQISGTNSLSTCLVSAEVPLADAGTCIECVAPAGADGGLCAIPCTPATDGGVCALD